MKANQLNRLILVSLLSICLFLLLDTYVIPMDTSKGVLVTKKGQEFSMLRVAIFRIQTEEALITVPGIAYHNIEINDTVVVGRSAITHSILKVGIYRKGKSYEWRIGFVFLGGLNFLVLLITSISAYLFFFYNRLKREESRRDITIFLAFLTSLFILFYCLFQ